MTAEPLHHLHSLRTESGTFTDTTLTEFLGTGVLNFNQLRLAAIRGCQHVELPGAALTAIYK